MKLKVTTGIQKFDDLELKTYVSAELRHNVVRGFEFCIIYIRTLEKPNIVQLKYRAVGVYLHVDGKDFHHGRSKETAYS